MSSALPGSALAAEMRRQQFSELLKISPQAILILDTDGRIREWNPAAVELLGWSRAEALGRTLHGLVPRAYRAELKLLWSTLQATRQAGSVRSSHLHRDGAGVVAEVYMAPIQDVDGSFAGVVATLTRQDQPGARGGVHAIPHEAADLSESAQARAVPALALSALELDDVTGLPGRRWLQGRLIAALPEGQQRAVAVLDVDAFALVNQGYGPEAGDEVLRQLAGRLAAVSGAAGLGRWQADEFVCVVDAVDAAADLNALIARMAPVAREPFQLAGDLVRLTLSAGLVSSTSVPLPMLFRSASAAMAAAKARGRDRTVWFDETTPPSAGGAGLRMANELHRGIAQGEMRLVFQPIIELATNDVDGVEALVRWERPNVGLLAPGAFIEIAEQTGQIVALGAWVIRQACQAAVDFEAVGLAPLRVSINVSARQLSDPGLADMLEDALRETGCVAANIAIEVTETALLHDMRAATAVLETIKGLGVELDLDDFGTGYSSLLYLRHFPVDRIKIDQSFVGGLGTSVADTAIVASTIALAHSVGLTASAEGVETTEQLTMLRQMGCDFAQGYLLGRPVPEDQLLTWLALQVPSRLVPREARPAGVGETSGASRANAAEQRDHLSDERDDVADRRDDAGDRRDIAGQHRDHAGDERDQDADQRDQAGDLRDSAGDRRDDVADRRDLAADQRDEQPDQRDDATSPQEGSPTGLARDATGQEVLEPSALARDVAAADRSLAAQNRMIGVGDRLQAERDRGLALVSRGAADEERLQARGDRMRARADRVASAQDRQRSTVDALTGALLREAGLMVLMTDMADATRRGQPLTLVCVAVDSQAEDPQAGGQMGADAHMVLVANALGANLRETELLVRDGPKHFLCVLPGLTAKAAAERLADLDRDLAGPPRLVAMTLGYAELRPQESPQQLIDRANAARLRGASGSPGPP